MSKFIVVSLDGTMDSLSGTPTHIQHIQDLLGGERYLSRTTPINNKDQGWRIQYYFDNVEHQKNEKPFMVSYYDEGLGAPTLNDKGEIDKWSVRPLQFATKLYNTFEEFREAALAEGITHNVAQAYKFMAQYYKPGSQDSEGNIIEPADKIYCFGFSRGAYTARLLSTMIRSIGLINTSSPAFRETYGSNLNQAIADGFACYRHGVHPDANTRAQAFKKRFCHDGKHIIHFMGLFEPVKGWITECVPKDKRVGNVPKHLRQALAIDEARQQFAPTIGIPSIECSAMTTWFPGSHADAGGGYRTRNEISHVSLHWMMDEAVLCGLPVDEAQLHQRFPINYFSAQHNSLADAVPFSGDILRWKDISRTSLRNIAVTAPGETIHRSAFYRFSKEVHIQDKDGTFELNPYVPENLVRAIEALNNPYQQPAAQSLLLYNYQHGFKVPETLPLDERDIQEELDSEARIKALRQQRAGNV